MALTITVTAEQLGAKIGVTDADERARLLDEATALLTDATASAWRDMPAVVANECVYRIARALKDAGKTSTGSAQLQVNDGTPVPRAPSDPLASSYKLIHRYVVPL